MKFEGSLGERGAHSPKLVGIKRAGGCVGGGGGGGGWWPSHQGEDGQRVDFKGRQNSVGDSSGSFGKEKKLKSTTDTGEKKRSQGDEGKPLLGRREE